MSILNTDNLNIQVNRTVAIVVPLEEEFKKSFNSDYIPVVLVDPMHEIDVHKVADQTKARYLDLSQAIEYPQLCRIVRDSTSIIFDNIDNIADTEYKEDIQYLVKYALRKDDEVPTPGNTCISFSDYRIGARCRQAPLYLDEGSKACPLYRVVPQ